MNRPLEPLCCWTVVKRPCVVQPTPPPTTVRTRPAVKNISAPKPTKPHATGVISEFELYTKESVKKGLGIGEDALQSMFAKGLRKLKHGKRVYIAGIDVIQFLKKLNSKDVEKIYLIS